MVSGPEPAASNRVVVAPAPEVPGVMGRRLPREQVVLACRRRLPARRSCTAVAVEVLARVLRVPQDRVEVARVVERGPRPDRTGPTDVVAEAEEEQRRLVERAAPAQSSFVTQRPR
jgi:hypothetical protein